MPQHTFICLTCKKEITKYIRPARLKKLFPKYCSAQCKHKGARRERTNVPCAFCAKVFTRRISLIKSEFVFCSRECKDKAQATTGGNRFTEMRPEHYANGVRFYRKRAFSSLGKKCQICSYNKCVSALQVHHKDEDRKNNSLSNLQVVCQNCHAEIHHCK